MRIPVRNQSYADQDVYFDRHSWSNCNFSDCNIIIETGEFDVMQCSFKNCRITAKGNALAILKIVKLFFPETPLLNDAEKSGQ